MKLSIIIVNYNVMHFLEQCLNSVMEAIKTIEAEVIVVDNNSVDGSLQMLSEKFPDLILIANKDNRGFSKANNQGIRVSKGEYVLLLNPDTIVEEDTFVKALAFMDQHPDAGGLGVKMLDGKGRFLPESKRGLPTPAAAFYKMFGFSKLFPQSKRFASYHQGHLDADAIHQVEVLSGAFMLMRKQALDKVGLLDEDFFMYGEDIDLSYRLLKGGYKNYYFPKTRIIHYKGESTKKNTVNYVFVFYNAMVIFAKKHYSSENAKLFSLLINTAIIFRAIISLLASTFKKLLVPFIDFCLIYMGVFLTAKYWGQYILGGQYSYPALFLYVFIPIIIIFWQVVIYYSGGYDKPIKPLKIIGGQLVGSLLVLVIYALLPESYRFSRALLLFASLWSIMIMLLWRLLFFSLGFKSLKMGNKLTKNIAVVGEEQEARRVLDLIKKTAIDASAASIIISDEVSVVKDNLILGNIRQLSEIVNIHKINELIFCAKSLQSAEIINLMTQLKSTPLEFKIAPPKQMFIIGSNSINTSSDIYFIEMNAINKESNKRYKRLFDFSISLTLILLFPLHFFLFKYPLRYLKNLFVVLLGYYTFVGLDSNLDGVLLPNMKKSILHPLDMMNYNGVNQDVVDLNLVYAKNYKIRNDLIILFKSFRKLDRKI